MSYRSDGSVCTTGTWQQNRDSMVVNGGDLLICNGNGDNSGGRPSLSDSVVGQGDFLCRVLNKISAGSFGDVYKGSLESNGEHVAVKSEKTNTPNQLLLNEGSIYRQLENGPGIPRVYWFGIHPQGYNLLIMELLGPSLQQVFKKQKYHFSLKTVLLLADQMFQAMEFVHSRGLLHRDISSNNFMLGGNDVTRLYLIDFGHAKKFATGFYVKPMQRRVSIPQAFVGTPRFTSLATHLGKEPGRRDDMESLGYLFVYLMKGSLPWQGQKIINGQTKLAKIMQLKATTSLAVLCEGIPNEFMCYLELMRCLGQLDCPPYAHIRSSFMELAKRMNISYDGQFDWMQQVEGNNEQ